MSTEGTRLIVRGQWNVVEGFVGIPQSGKTVKMMQRCVELARTPAYIIAHDPNCNLPDALPDGTPTGIKRYESLAELRQELKRDGSGIHAVGIVDAGPLFAFSVELARAGFAVGRDGREYGVPVVLALDEVACVEDSNEHRLGPALKDMLMRRRPHHVAMLYGTQSPRLCHRQLFGLATTIHLFRITDSMDLDRLRESTALAPHADSLPTLPQYTCVSVDIGAFR